MVSARSCTLHVCQKSTEPQVAFVGRNVLLLSSTRLSSTKPNIRRYLHNVLAIVYFCLFSPMCCKYYCCYIYCIIVITVGVVPFIYSFVHLTSFFYSPLKGRNSPLSRLTECKKTRSFLPFRQINDVLVTCGQCIGTVGVL